MDISDRDSARPAYRTPEVLARSRADVANLVALVGLLALGVAFLAGCSVLADDALAVKFENGYLPPGTDVATIQTAACIALGALVAGVSSVVAAAALRATGLVTAVFILTLATAPVYLPAGLLIYGLAF